MNNPPPKRRGGARPGAGRKIGPHGRSVVLPYRVGSILVQQVSAKAMRENRTAREIHNEALARGLAENDQD